MTEEIDTDQVDSARAKRLAWQFGLVATVPIVLLGLIAIARHNPFGMGWWFAIPIALIWSALLWFGQLRINHYTRVIEDAKWQELRNRGLERYLF